MPPEDPDANTPWPAAKALVARPPLDLCFCLSFSQILPADFRARFHHCLVVHESDLPHGKGWSPLTWQILEGRNRIPVTLIQAADRVDSGPIYAQRWLDFQGHELIAELRAGQAAATLALCRWFVDDYPASAEQARPQQGEESIYPRRRPADSRLDPQKTLAEQFELLRVVDNTRYPAFFEWRGRRYTLRLAQYPELGARSAARPAQDRNSVSGGPAIDER
jgi:methionyl-tRNA formyltransferase